MSFALTPILSLPAGFAALAVASEREGYDFLKRLAARWQDGAYDDDELASVWAGEEGGVLIAIGAQTYDEYDPPRYTGGCATSMCGPICGAAAWDVRWRSN